MSWTRANAMLTMTSPLGADQLIPIKLTAHEAISEPYRFDVEVVSQAGVVDPDQLLNQKVCVTLNSAAETPARYFHGIVQSVTALGGERGLAAAQYYYYGLVIVPTLWFLGQTVDCRVYQNLTTVDILKSMFSDFSLTDVSFPSPGAAREYTVQFNETDLHFATRLMEEEGYFYFFTHTDSAHTLVIANNNQAFKDISGASLHLGGGDSDGTLLNGWTRPKATTRGSMKFGDHDPTRPTVDLTSQSTTVLKTGGASTRDHYRYPALTATKDVVAARAKNEMEAAEARVSLYEAGSRFGALCPGGKFTLACRPASSDDGTYVLREVTHNAEDSSWLAGGGGSEYTNHFAAFPSATNWRQPLVTARPRMEGIHVGLVLGPNSKSGSGVKDGESEEIYTDSMARVKVRFFWDHRQDASGSLACWARVVQPWAGNGWGAQFIPRIGTEVAVAFVDSDPDRPIVIGGLYNGSDAPIYSDSDKTKSGFRSRSSLKGAAADFNEFTFDDKKDSELIFMHAQKDLTTEVEHDQTLTVDNCRVVTVKKDETVDIQNNQTIKVKNAHTFTVTDGNRAVSVNTGNNTFTVKQGNNTVSIDTGNYDVTVGQGNHSLDVKTGNYSVKVDTGNHSLDVSTGNYTVKTDVGSVSVEATQGITLKVGGNSLKIDPSGIALNGIMLKLEGQGMATLKAPMTQVSGDGMLTLKGGIMMLN